MIRALMLSIVLIAAAPWAEAAIPTELMAGTIVGQAVGTDGYKCAVDDGPATFKRAAPTKAYPPVTIGVTGVESMNPKIGGQAFAGAMVLNFSPGGARGRSSSTSQRQAEPFLPAKHFRSRITPWCLMRRRAH
jgi:hypothetical protein